MCGNSVTECSNVSYFAGSGVTRVSEGFLGDFEKKTMQNHATVDQK